MKKIILITLLIAFFLLISFSVIKFLKYTAITSKATADEITINSNQFKTNYYNFSKSTSSFSFYNQRGITQFNSSNRFAINSLLQKSIIVDNKLLLPKNSFNNFSVIKEKFDKNSNKSHYFLQQKINNIPVIGGEINLHLNKNILYSLQGNITNNQEILPELVSQNEASKTVINYLKKKYKLNSVNITKIDKKILNKKLLGTAQDEKNYPIAIFTVNYNNKSFFSKKIFFNLNNGKIESESYETVYEFIKGVAMVPEVEPEFLLNQFLTDPFQPPLEMIFKINDAPVKPTGFISKNTADKINQTYEDLGLLYTFFKDKFSYRSYDNKDGAMIVAIYQSLNLPFISNGFTLSLPNPYIFLSSNLLGKNVIGHEFGHKLNFNTWQSLLASYDFVPITTTIAESLADIISVNYANNWRLNIPYSDMERYFDNPTKNKHPDRLFSPYTAVWSEGTTASHTNATIINHSFYLMANGGNFNNCKIDPLGRDIPLKIIFHAMESYLPSFANMQDFYRSVTSSCLDLYESENSKECKNVINAMKAVELDQSNNSQLLPQFFSTKPKSPSCN